MLLNAGPHGAAKIQSYPDAFFAYSVTPPGGKPQQRVLQTRVLQDGLQGKGVGALTYSGAFPVSKLAVAHATPEDAMDAETKDGSALDTALDTVDVSLFAYSTFKVGNIVGNAIVADMDVRLFSGLTG
jgi:hypothetical protein